MEQNLHGSKIIFDISFKSAFLLGPIFLFNMKNIITILLAINLFSGCVTSKHIKNEESIALQEEIRRTRTGLNAAEAGLFVGSVVLSATIGIDAAPETSSKNFRKLKVLNESTTDTLIVNMVTDVIWKDDRYCDIRDIVIPPMQTVKLIAPIDASYNVYFRPVGSDTDEKIEINSSGRKIIKLKSGMTQIEEK